MLRGALFKGIRPVGLSKVKRGLARQTGYNAYTTKTEGTVQEQEQGSSLPQSVHFRPHLDYRTLSETMKENTLNMERRRFPTEGVEAMPELYSKYRGMQNEVNDMRARRNALSKRIPGLRAASKVDGDDGDAAFMELERVLDEAAEIKGDIEGMEEGLGEVEVEMQRVGSLFPNRTHPDTPVGSEDQAKIVKTHGEAPIAFAFEPQDHVALGKAAGFFDMVAGAMVSGARFTYLRGDAALLEMALVQYTLSYVVSQGYTPVSGPDVVKAEVVEACGFRPRDTAGSQIYRVAPEAQEMNEGELNLVGTAEIPLAGMLAGRILEKGKGPEKYVAFGRCFRAEAGSRGRDTRGIYRLHQFSKVEMFGACAAEESDGLLEEFREIQERLYASLGLSYRVLDMPTEELGASAYRKYDVEAWMPGRGGWGEISSASNCTDYQARRLNLRYRTVPRGPLHYAHTVNGTACAVPRMIIAILETHQMEDGRIRVPEALVPYMLGKETIG